MDKTNQEILTQLREYAAAYFPQTILGEYQSQYLPAGNYTASQLLTKVRKAVFKSMLLSENEDLNESIITVSYDAFSASFKMQDIFVYLAKWEAMCKVGKDAMIFAVSSADAETVVTAKVIIEKDGKAKEVSKNLIQVRDNVLIERTYKDAEYMSGYIYVSYNGAYMMAHSSSLPISLSDAKFDYVQNEMPNKLQYIKDNAHLSDTFNLFAYRAGLIDRKAYQANKKSIAIQRLCGDTPNVYFDHYAPSAESNSESPECTKDDTNSADNAIAVASVPIAEPDSVITQSLSLDALQIIYEIVSNLSGCIYDAMQVVFTLQEITSKIAEIRIMAGCIGIDADDLLIQYSLRGMANKAYNKHCSTSRRSRRRAKRIACLESKSDSTDDSCNSIKSDFSRQNISVDVDIG